MKSQSISSKALLLILLLIGVVLHDTFTSGLQFFSVPILSFLQGFFAIAIPAGIYWIFPRKIHLNPDNGSNQIDIVRKDLKLTESEPR